MIITARFPSSCTLCQGQIKAGEKIEWNRNERGAKHASRETCETFRRRPVEPPVLFDASGLIDFLRLAGKKLLAPKARFLSPANEEMRLSIAGPRSRNPGSLQITIAGVWVGSIRTDQVVTGPLKTDKPVLETLTAIQEDPLNAAKAYGAMMSRCSFCNLPLTDEGSVENGYGPICAANRNLPWIRLGVPVLTQIPEVEARAELARLMAEDEPEEMEEMEEQRAGR